MFNEKEYQDQPKRLQEKGTGPIKPEEPNIQLEKVVTSHKNAMVIELETSKKKPANLERQHNLHKRNRGLRAPSDMAMWVTKRLAEDKLDKTMGILSLWSHSP